MFQHGTTTTRDHEMKKKTHIHTQVHLSIYLFSLPFLQKRVRLRRGHTHRTHARTHLLKQQAATTNQSSLAIIDSGRNATGKILRHFLSSRIVIGSRVPHVFFLLIVFDACYLGIQWPRSRTWS